MGWGEKNEFIALTLPSFHLMGVAVIFVDPSSKKVKVFVSFVFSK